LFLVVQIAQAKPANINMINLMGKGPLPCSQVSEKCFNDFGQNFQWKISLKIPQSEMDHVRWLLLFFEIFIYLSKIGAPFQFSKLVLSFHI
jgi:hypothetical protein